MRAVPDEPGEGHAGIALAAFPAVAVHHRQPLAEDENARESALFQEHAAALGFIEGRPQQHDHARAQIERVLDELLDQLVGGISNDALAAVGELVLQQEIAPPEAVRATVIDEIRADDVVAREGDVVVLDALRERKPAFSPEDVVSEFAELLKSYRITKITGDRYAGDWPRERFREHGVSYEPAQKPKSDLYRDLLPAINSRKLDLLDDARLLTQLVALERRTARGGRDSIDHAPGTHDDVANALAGLAATAKRGAYDSSLSWVSDSADDFQRQRLYHHILQTGGYYRQR